MKTIGALLVCACFAVLPDVVTAQTSLRQQAKPSDWGARTVLLPVLTTHGGFNALCNPRAAQLAVGHVAGIVGQFFAGAGRSSGVWAAATLPVLSVLLAEIIVSLKKGRCQIGYRRRAFDAGRSIGRRISCCGDRGAGRRAR